MNKLTRTLALLCCLLMALALSACTTRETKLEHAFVFNKDTQTLISYHGDATHLTIPARIKGTAVKVIGEGCFDSTVTGEEPDLDGKYSTNRDDRLCNILSVEIPDGVEEIRAYAFGNMLKLEEITIPDSVTSIDTSAFMEHDGSVISGVLPALKAIHVKKDSDAQKILEANADLSPLLKVDD